MLPNILGYPLIDGAYWFLERLLFFYAIIYILIILKLLDSIREVFLIWLMTATTLPVIVSATDLNNISANFNLLYKIFAYIFNFKYIAFFQSVFYFTGKQKICISIKLIGLL